MKDRCRFLQFLSSSAIVFEFLHNRKGPLKFSCNKKIINAVVPNNKQYLQFPSRKFDKARGKSQIQT